MVTQLCQLKLHSYQVLLLISIQNCMTKPLQTTVKTHSKTIHAK